MKTWQSILFGILLGVLFSGVTFLLVKAPTGEPISLLPPQTPVPLIVHISGQVKNPGVYSLPYQSRVAHAIEMAGGATNAADLSVINLAGLVQDGSKIYVPSLNSREEPQQITQPEKNLPSNQATISTPSPDNPLNINTASQEELEQLPGIGPSKAKNIIDYRNTNGLFSNKEQVNNVSGIGLGIYNTIKDIITVSEY